MIIFEKSATIQEDDYITGCLLDYNYFEKYYKMIAINNLNKQQALGTDPRVIQQINFTGNLEQQATIFLITEEAKETILGFSQGTVKVF